jgi:hypothetical protein
LVGKVAGGECIAQPLHSVTSTSRSSTQTSFAGSGQALSFIRTALTLLLQLSRILVGLSHGCQPFSFDDISALSVGGQVGEGEDGSEADGGPQAPVQEGDHANVPPARS